MCIAEEGVLVPRAEQSGESASSKQAVELKPSRALWLLRLPLSWLGLLCTSAKPGRTPYSHTCLSSVFEPSIDLLLAVRGPFRLTSYDVCL